MKPADTPKVSRLPSLPLIWVVPLLSLGIGSWMILREYRNYGPEITVEFTDASGVEAGKTRLEYKGVSVGEVQNVELNKDLKSVQVRVRLDKDAAGLARGGTQFWIVHPRIDFSGVRGLETLVSGAYLALEPGTGAPTKDFKGVDQPPPPQNKEWGPAFLLESDRLDSITTGAPVYFREMKVGETEASQLSGDSTKVFIRVRILAPYEDLVRTNTVFWNTGGLSFKMNLFGAELNTKSLESLFQGGVAFATPEGKLAPPAADGAQFRLEAEAPRDALNWRQQIPIHSPENAPEAPARHDSIPFVN